MHTFVFRTLLNQGPKAFNHRCTGLFASLVLSLVFSGCGGTRVNTTIGGAVTPSSNAVAFGAVEIGQSASSNITLANQSAGPVEISKLDLSGNFFSFSENSNLPITLGAGSTLSLNVKFVPTAEGTSTGSVSIASNSPTSPQTLISLTGTGTIKNLASVSSLSCSSVSVAGPATDACTITLSTNAPYSGFPVNLSSSDAAVSVPPTVTVLANNSTGTFTATVSATGTARPATLTASAAGISKTFGLQLVAANSPILSFAPDLAFGNVVVNTPTTKSFLVTSAGTVPVTISRASATGSGFSFSAATLTSTAFSMAGATFPMTLRPGQSASVTVQFDPTAAGSVTGKLAIATDSSISPNAIVSLSGTGVTSDNPNNTGVSALSCDHASLTGSGTDACTVTLTSNAPSGGLVVNMSSNGSEVTVPLTVTVPEKASSIGFIANAAAVTANKSITLTASADKTSKTFSLELNATTPVLSLSSTSLAFGSTTVNAPATKGLTLTSTGNASVTISAATLSGTGFTMSGATFPITLSPNQSAELTVKFDPVTAGATTGQVTVISNSHVNPTMNVGLSGTGTTPNTAALNDLTCANTSLTGAGTDSCTVTLSAPAPSTGMNVHLSSSNAVIALPANVVIPANASSIGFTVNVAQVNTPQSVMLTATAGSAAKTLALQLNAVSPTITISTNSLAFGSVALNTAATKTVIVSSTGNGPLTINSANATGTGFTVSGASFPVTLTPNQAVELTVQFVPAGSGVATGMLIINSNSATSPTSTVGLSGTGTINTALTALACTTSTFTATGTDACTVTLTAPASTGGFNVRLSSSNAAVNVPSSVTVPANANSAGFSATVSSVATAQTANITASAGSNSQVLALQLNAATPALTVTSSSVAFGNIAVNASTNKSVTLTSTGTVPVTLNSASISGAGFTVSGATFPLTLNPSQAVSLTIQFAPTVSGSATGSLLINSNSSTGPTAAVALSGTGTITAALSALTCSNASFTGAGTDACTVTLTAPAPTGGLSIGLSSSNTAVAVPSSVTVPANAISAAFTATVSRAATAQAVTLAASTTSNSASFSLQLNAATPLLTISATGLDFGNVQVDTSVTKSLTLTSTGSVAVTVSAASLTGSGFTMSGATFPLNLNPNQTVSLSLQFDPAAAGNAMGQLTFTSNSSTNATSVVSLTGTGTSTSTLSGYACSSASLSGAATDACTVTLNSAAPASGVDVVLNSSNPAVSLPVIVTVPANALTATVTATISPVSSAQSVTLTATAGSVSKTFALQLNASQIVAIYVDGKAGSDSSAGTYAVPLKTIQAAVNKADANNQKSIATTIIVNPGVYREYVNVPRISRQTAATLTIQAAATGTVIISGSNVLSNWTPESGNPSIYSNPWQYKFGACALPSGWPANLEPITLRTEMLFVDHAPLTQVMHSSDLQPGTFFVDEANSSIHAWPAAGTDMQTALVEAAVRPNTLNVSGRTNVTLRGLVLQHANTCINRSGANIMSSSNVLIDQVQALWNSWGGLGVSSSTAVTVQNSIANYNGGVGFLANQDQNALYNFNETDYNNWRGAQGAFYEWAMGGTKLFAMRDTTVQNHFSYNNQGEGLWFDTDNKNITVDNATLVGNVTAGLQIERNEGPLTLQNSHLCSSGVGVNVLTSEKVTIKNNSFYNNGGTNKYQAQIYLAGQAGGINITDWQTGQVYNLFTTGLVMTGNTLQDGAVGQNLFGTYLAGTDWSEFATTLNASNNKWYDSSSSTPFKILNGKLVNLAGWQSATGTDYTSVWAATSASPASACAVPTPSYADFHVDVDKGSYTMSSGQAVATIHVDSFNYGNVTLHATGMPAGVTASISQPNLVGGLVKLTLSANASATAQTLPITLWAASSDRVHSVTFRLAVAP